MGSPEQLATPLRALDELRSIARPEPLDGYRQLLVELVAGLLAEGADAVEVTQAVARVNDTLTARLLALAEAELGPVPCRYAWLSLGSQGRGEQVLSSDQDSAVAYEDDAPEAARGYVAALADLVVEALARAGLPRCAGGYMATTWCRPLGDYQRLFRGWVTAPEPQALLQAEVFLDVRAAHGTLPADPLGAVLVGGGGERSRFLVMMARAAVTFRPPLRPLGGVRARDGVVDVKLAGIAALVLLARLYALAAGSDARTTPLRLAAAAEAGTLSRAGAAQLTEAYRFLTRLRLRHQLDQARRGVAPDNLVPLDDLTPAERRRLRDVLHAVRDTQAYTATRFATHTVT